LLLKTILIQRKLQQITITSSPQPHVLDSYHHHSNIH